MIIPKSLKSVYHIKSVLGNPKNINLIYKGKILKDTDVLTREKYHHVEIQTKGKGGVQILESGGSYNTLIFIVALVSTLMFYGMSSDVLRYMIFNSANTNLKLPNPYREVGTDKSRNENILYANNILSDATVLTYSLFDLDKIVKEKGNEEKFKRKIGNNPPDYFGIMRKDHSFVGNLYRLVSYIFYFLVICFGLISFFGHSSKCHKPKSGTEALIIFALIFVPLILPRLYNFLSKMAPPSLAIVKMVLGNFKAFLSSMILLLGSGVMLIVFRNYLTPEFAIGFGILFACLLVTFIFQVLPQFGIPNVIHLASKYLRSLFGIIMFNSPGYLSKSGKNGDNIRDKIMKKYKFYNTSNQKKYENSRLYELVGDEDDESDYFMMYRFLYKIFISVPAFIGYLYGVDDCFISGLKKICSQVKIGDEKMKTTLKNLSWKVAIFVVVIIIIRLIFKKFGLI